MYLHMSRRYTYLCIVIMYIYIVHPLGTVVIREVWPCQVEVAVRADSVDS